jgi:hypothetical protein
MKSETYNEAKETAKMENQATMAPCPAHFSAQAAQYKLEGRSTNNPYMDTEVTRLAYELTDHASTGPTEAARAVAEERILEAVCRWGWRAAQKLAYKYDGCLHPLFG